MTGATDVLRDAAALLSAAGIESARLEARLLLAHILGISPDELISGARAIDSHAHDAFTAALNRRLGHEPLAYIVGSKEFWSLPFAVGPGALIPRPETELMIEMALARHADHNAALRALDLGTGSGCILLAFLATFPNATGLGIDISEQALHWARQNAQMNGLTGRSQFVIGDWARDLTETFDVIFTNPPYIDAAGMASLAPDVKNHEPELALLGGADGMACYHALAPHIANHLASKGHAFVEIGMGQEAAVSAIMAGAGLETHHIATDLAGIARCLVLGHSQADHEKTVGNRQMTR